MGPQCYGRQANFAFTFSFLKTEGKIIWKAASLFNRALKVFLFKRIQGLVHLSPQNPLGVVWLSLTGN